MVNLSKTFGKLTIPLLVLLAISFSALPAQAKYGGERRVQSHYSQIRGRGGSITIITDAYSANSQVSADSFKSEVYIESTGKAVFTCDDAQWLSNPGEPHIPWKVITVLLPPDADMSSISVNTDNIQYKPVGTCFVPPTSPDVTWNNDQKVVIWPEDKIIVNGRDVNIYDSDAFWPQVQPHILGTGKIYKYQLAQIAIPHVRYNPVSNELIKLIHTDVAVIFDRVAATKSLSLSMKQYRIGKARVQKLAVNFNQMHSTYDAVVDKSMLMSMESSNSDPNLGYTIITTSSIISGSAKLAEFVTHKQSLGFDVQVITELDFGGGTGDTAAENIRSWLQSNYISDNIEYVLLIGNPDPNDGNIPMKMLYPMGSQSYEVPSDFYYADLTGKWDSDDNGFYGEWGDDFIAGGVDKFWEVLVGRIPYYGSISDMDAILDKTIYYETQTGSAAWRKNVLLPMDPLDDLTPGYHLGEAIKDDFLIANGWSYHRVYEEDYNLMPPPETTPCDYNNVTNVWNGDANNSDGKFGLVVWATHGNRTIAEDVMNTSHVPYLDNNYPSFTFQESCHNSYPEVTNNLAYQILKNGGICTIGPTRLSWYQPGQTYFVGSATSHGMTYGYAARITEGLTSGEALYSLKLVLGSTYSQRWMNLTVFNIYGDPSIRIINRSGQTPSVRYVDSRALPGGDGWSWETAYNDLQDAIEDASLHVLDVNEIHVATGTYTPDRDTGDRETAFQLVNGVAIKGGYAGLAASDPNVRDPNLYVTILSGDLDGNDVDVNDPCDLKTESTRFENSYHVVTGYMTGPNAILDGFTIAEGQADGNPSFNNNDGGGMYNYSGGSQTLINCVFTRNFASYGGGMYNFYSNPTLNNCTFNENYAEWRGGGIYATHSSSVLNDCIFSDNGTSGAGGGVQNWNSSDSIFTNCTFNGNRSDNHGGGLYNDGSSPVLNNCIFNGNSAANWGGGIYSKNNSNPTLTNCILNSNEATLGGGMINYSYSNPKVSNCSFIGNLGQNGGGIANSLNCYLTLANCTFYGNSAANSGGGIWSAADSNSVVVNCIFWNNGNEIYNINNSTTTVSYSNIQGSWPGLDNINVDPCFADADANDFHLKSEGWCWDRERQRWDYDEVTSRCIDAGNPGSPLSDELMSVPDDPCNIWGENIRVNMGAYGGTAEASMPPYDWTLLADLTNDGIVNLIDYAAQSQDWQQSETEQPGDLNRDGTMDINDLAMFAEDWLKQTSWAQP